MKSMGGYLLDTCVISELIRAEPSPVCHSPSLQGSTAITNGLIVVTLNTADMNGSGATLLERKGIDTTCMTACLVGKSVK